jgi:MFS-type transporter involved in bile tolerance (Atg22 family)
MPEREIGWGQVLLIAAGIVVLVVAVARLTQLLGFVDDLLGVEPVVIVALVAGTFWLLYFTFRRRRG